MMHATSPRISTPCADLLRRALLASALAWVSHVSGAAAQTQAHPAPPASAAPADDGQWSMPAKNYAATRYSELAEITTDNVKSLGVAFTFSTGTIKGQEAAPIVVDNTMFMVTPYPNYVYALDLTKPGAPMKWMYRAASRTRIAGRRVLRRRQSRRGLFGRQAVLQHARRQHHRARREDRQAAMEDASSATSTRARPSRWRRWW